MLTYSFANLQGESMYTHLYKCIKNDITNGVLHAEEKLRSVLSATSFLTSTRSPSEAITWRALSSSLCR